jgi:hypothetical protein
MFFSDRLLGAGKIRLSPFASTNDPRESKDWSFDVVSKGNLPELDIGGHLKLKEDATLDCAPLTGEKI